MKYKKYKKYKYLAIDWSGAKKLKAQIAVSALELNSCAPQILEPVSRKRWKREDVLCLLQSQASDESYNTIAGIDCNFGLPFVGNKYMLGVKAMSACSLWQTIDDACKKAESCGTYKYLGADKYYPEQFISEHLDDGFWRGKTKPADYASRCFRETEKVAKCCGLNPKSPLNLNGAGVAKAGLAGMRVLNQLKGQKDVAVWPFNDWMDSAALTVVEIYPALFLYNAEVKRSEIKNLSQLNKILAEKFHHEKACDVTGKIMSDEVDALISVAGIAKLLEDHPRAAKKPAEMAKLSDKVRRAEGWIFGVGRELMRK